MDQTLAIIAEFWGWIALIVLQLAASAFFSAAETALTGASRPRMHQMAQDGDRRAAIVKRLQERREQTIGALLLGNNLANIGSSAMATGVLIILFGEAGVAYATVVMTAAVLIFSEVMPKTYAINHADTVALHLARATRIVVAVLHPPVVVVRFIVRGILWLCGARLPSEHRIGTTEEELRGVIDLHAGPEPEVKHERAMLLGVLDLDEVTVAKVMTHRSNVVTADSSDPPRTIVDQVLASGHQSLPLTHGNPDNIVGVISGAVLMREVMQRGRELAGLKILELAEKPWFVPESTTLYDQLQAFRQRGQAIALVVDEYGALMGVVSLRDILEEIVGRMAERRGAAGSAPAPALPGVQPQPDGSYLVEGGVSLRDLNREFDWALPDDGAATVAGLVIHEARLIPSVGQVFTFHGFRFEILKRQRNQITGLRVVPPKREAAD